jgi:hypothetical protein
MWPEPGEAIAVVLPQQLLFTACNAVFNPNLDDWGLI